MAHLDLVMRHLREVDLFRSFDNAALELFAAAAQERYCRAGQTIFLRGDAAEGMFIVARGKVRLSVTSAEGRELTLRHVRTGSVFGEIALLDGGPRTADAVALKPSVLFTISRGRFQAIVDQSLHFAKALIGGLCVRLRDTTDQLEGIALMALDQRLARLFLQFAKATGSSSDHVLVPLDISQGELATLIAASRPKVNQLLVRWQAEGIATQTAGGITVSVAGLREIAYGTTHA